jgi:hypothetical protein
MSLPAVTADDAGEELGPAMAACNEQQRRFVRALIALGVRGKATEAARAAGYGGTKGTGLRVQAYRLSHNSRVQEAIHEEAVKMLGEARIIAIHVLHEIARDPAHPHQLKAATEILDRAGITAKTEHKIVVERTDTKVTVQSIIELARQLDIDPRKLLGKHGIVLDADYNIVSPGTEFEPIAEDEQ